MASSMPAPLHIIQDSRYAKQDGWELDDISLCSSGNIAVSGNRGYQSYVCIYGSTTADDNSDSRDKPTLLYHKQFTNEGLSWPQRYISFIKPDSTEIVTCWYNEVQVIDYNRDVVLRSRKVNGDTRCLSVSESQTFIGLRLSAIVNIYDNDLNEIKSIRLKGIRDDWPWDIAAAADILCVCTYDVRAIVYSQDSGSILTEYTIGLGQYGRALSIAVNIQLGLTAVLWYQSDTRQKQIIFYLLSENKSFLTVNVEFGVSIISISDQDRIVTGDKGTGELKVYNLASLFSYSRLKESLVSRLGRDDCEKLADFFDMGGEVLKGILNSDRPASTLLLALEEKGIIQPSNVDRLERAFRGLKMSLSFYHAVNMYWKLRDADEINEITSYDRFLATLSAHLTSSIPAELCDYFHVSEEQKDSIISSQNPGLSLLLILDEMGIIKPSEVGCLEEPFNKLRLVQALAKIDEYKEIVKEENGQLPQTALINSLEDKRALFVEFLKKKIKSWYETMTPVPWKKSCQWKSTDLFVGSGLILTESKAKQNVQNIDEQCKLNYTEIFTNEKLKSEIRIILEGDPGAGKTILSSQLVYDWSEGKIDGVDILIFLPLKIVENKTFIQAVKEFYIPVNTPLSSDDIESILASDTERICLLLDGLEEYSTWSRMNAKESSEVMKIMKKEKHSNCKVVITCRSDFAHDLPECPMLKLGRFGETERNSYIEKLLPHNTDKQQKIKRIIQDNPFILDLCSVPLLLVLAVHNIESLSLSEEGQLNKVSPFMRSIILTLCSSSTVKHEIDGKWSKFSRSEKMTVGELAFNGLCKGQQQLSWQKGLMESNVGSLKVWIDSGILVLEEDLVISEKEDQDISEIKKGKEKIKEEKSKGTHGELPVVSEDMVTASMSTSKAGHEVSKIEEQLQSVSELETGPHETTMETVTEAAGQVPQFPNKIIKKINGNTKKEKRKETGELTVLSEDMITPLMKEITVRRAAGQVPLTVKFLHKVIQEWFAATFFSSMMRLFTGQDQFQNYVFSQLQHISPTDLHYVLRFTSYLYPPSCHVIMNYLLRSYLKDGSVPPYIMDCVFLCFNEHNDVKGPDMRHVVTEVCKEVITIQSEDSRLLQQAKCALLRYASNDKVIIEKLELKDVIFAVDETSLILNSGVQLGILHTVKLIEVSRWDQVLQEEDFKNILKLLSAGTRLQKVCCIFPSQPPDSLDEITLGNIVSKDLKVEWHIGYLVQSLDPRTGKWMINSKQPGTGSTGILEVSADQDSLNLLEIATAITQNGGMLEIPNTGVALIVPPYALPEDMEECILKIRIIPRSMEEDGEPSFSSNSSVVVELLPDNLRLRRHVRLRLPHCLVLHQTKKRKIKIFVSHHGKEKHPQWKERTDLPYNLEDSSCVILLDSFCWVKFRVNDSIVEAKKIVVYAASDKPSPQDDATIIEVGYHTDLPSETEFLQKKPRIALVDKRTFFFRKTKYPLKLSLDKIFSKAWEYSPEDKKVKEIPRETIASSTPHSFFYVLQRRGSSMGNFLCLFKASQEKGQIPVQLACYPQTKYYNRLLTCDADTFSEPLLKTEECITQKGGTLKIPQTGVELEVPSDALPDNIEQCKVYMTIMPSRNMQDEVVSFSSNSSVAVEIFADDLKLKSPAKLRLPHCLELHKSVERKVKIFTQHVGEDKQTHWKKETGFQFHLEHASCIIWMDRLCSIKYHVDNEIVIGKKIVVYTATRKDIEKNELANVEIGYYPDMPGGGELLRMNPNIVVDYQRTVPYKETVGNPLELSIKRIFPQEWRCPFPGEKLQKVPFRMIAGSIEHSYSYILQRTGEEAGNPVCIFTAVQDGGHIPVELVVKAYLQQEDQPKFTSQNQEREASADHMTATFQHLSKNIGPEWLDVGRMLGLKDSDLDHIQADYSSRRQEAIYQMLLYWKRTQGSKATYNILIMALDKSGRTDLSEKV